MCDSSYVMQIYPEMIFFVSAHFSRQAVSDTCRYIVNAESCHVLGFRPQRHKIFALVRFDPAMLAFLRRIRGYLHLYMAYIVCLICELSCVFVTQKK